MVEATGFEPAASASRTQRSTKLSHASISIKFSPQNYSKFRICGIICGRSGIYRYFLYTVPPMKWLFVRDCRSSADFTLTVRYGIPNAALYQTEPHLVIKLNLLLTFFSTVFLRCYSAYSCGARKILCLGAAKFFDRCAFSYSLFLPQAALALKATKLSHTSLLN